MTIREAMIQAQMELGKSSEAAELGAKYSDAVLPGGAAGARFPVKPGLERECIEGLKRFFRKLDANPGVLDAYLQNELAKRAEKN